MASGVPGGSRSGSSAGERIGGCLGQVGCSIVFIAILLGIGASCDSDSNPEEGDVCYDVGEQVTNSAGETFICQ
ncbi:hypothetical protein Sipo8835_29505 [Streptomyces ipomoeae]|jgi:hypothetical protein|uniref:Uncharacterized protein n=1 Tax=Streptomyces ipomoeae TaxID=103232 RepID=A0A540PTD5_9ACTN|nr:hypothetical protein [Streptomyces ipomoeae]MDX2696543.1 hypothetical protein [Streptomyces ipomoeae]MDX2824637.1 hypothetical protein [Streptomyces ipomoeae]MDX2841949.1 hypothetical protein [Streptomyces ipomoeae]MDX2879394.1 hypothetical protein [Streptomyces ipomoeae]MDX2932940.1 hypothetical protein [Streptomyces ipomoeae]